MHIYSAWKVDHCDEEKPLPFRIITPWLQNRGRVHDHDDDGDYDDYDGDDDALCVDDNRSIIALWIVSIFVAIYLSRG